MRTRSFFVFAAALALGATCLRWYRPETSLTATLSPELLPTASIPPAVVGDASVVIEAYESWREAFGAGPHVIEIGLSRAASHVDRLQGLRGVFSIDLDDGTGVVRVESACEPLEAWLVANVDGPRRSFLPEEGDVCRRLGEIPCTGGESELEFDLSGPEWRDMALDTIVVTRAGVRPEEGALLTGQPNVFERLYGRELASMRDEPLALLGTGLPLAMVPIPAPQIGSFEPATQIKALVDHGEKLFFFGTFNGNGRTCGTCHPAEHNFTLDPKVIADMHAANPFDPLFLAEFDPNLDSTQNGGLMFEQPVLMHKFALILENLDGFGDLFNRFVMRAVSHTFAQDVQRLKPVVGQSPPKERLGWSGDGAPGAGTLRDFATGAVTQHFPKTLNRVAGVDFDLPSNAELDALEAFQLALGRQNEFELSNPFDPNFIAFDDVQAEQGKNTFLGLRCGTCHENAGGQSFLTTDNGTVVVGDPINFTLANGNFDTGVEAFLTNNPDGTGLPRPIDGGFGIQPQGMPPPWGPFFPIPNPDGSFGDMSFNTPSVVEFADTLPGFHNNITESTPLDPDPVVSAVLFYRTAEFGNSGAGQQLFGGPLPVGLGDAQDIARFLRAINAVQNGRNAIRFLEQALIHANLNFPGLEPIVNRGCELADFEVEDAEQQTQPFGFVPDPNPNYNQARFHIAQAQNPFLSYPTRIKHIHYAIKHLKLAELDLVQ